MRDVALALCLLVATCAHVVAAEPLRIGSKNFTESLVIAEIVRIEGQRDGVAIEHQRALGGTRILWRALQQGSIDLYPEYTGSLTHELLPSLPADATVDVIRKELAKQNLDVSEPLGFEDSYALGMRADAAAKLGIDKISDLAARPQLRLGLSSEFLDRSDGWPGLRNAYALPQTPRGLDHDLAYRALADDALDVVDLYTSDAEIPYYHLRVLADDRRYFPPYRAVLVLRKEAMQRQPALDKVLKAMAGRIDIDAMREMNAAVKLRHESDSAVAAKFLGIAPADTAREGMVVRVLQRTREHLALVAASLSLAIVIAIPLGILAAHRRRPGALVLSATGVLQTVPSLAMFVFMIPLFGIGAKPAIAALFLYSLLPIVRNTQAGLTGIAAELRESAAALGLPPRARLWHVELPLALRSILAGIKTAAVINVGTATLGALIGAAGYGQPILTGIRLDDVGLILEGAIPAAVLALLVQGVFTGIERALTPRGLRIAARR